MSHHASAYLRFHRSLHRLLTLLLLALWIALPAGASEIHYSFRDREGGGLAVLSIDPHTGALREHRRTWHGESFDRARKFALLDDGSMALLTDSRDRRGNLALIALAGEQAGQARILDFPSEPDEVRAVPGGFLIGGASGNLLRVDAATASVGPRWSSRDRLRPSGHKPEDIAILAGGERALLSLQKDSSSGKHRGSRLVTVRLPTLEVEADLHLPRDRPDLHIEGNRKEQGPNPEVLVLSPATNTLLVTLDLYGALLLTDLDAALTGRLANERVFSADPQGRFGVAFPDRVVHLPAAAGRGEVVLVANAGEDGGVVAVDLATRRRLAAVETPPGLDTLTHLRALDAVAAASAGKLKVRIDGEVEKTSRPGRSLWLFPLAGLAAGDLTAIELALDEPCHASVAIESADSARILLVLGSGRSQSLALGTIDRDGDGRFSWREQWRIPAEGEVQRLQRR